MNMRIAPFRRRRRRRWTPQARDKRGSAPIDAAGDETLPLAALPARLDRTQEGIAAALTGLDEAALARELTRGERTMTVGQRLFFLYFHESYHVGQTELFRQLASIDDKVI